MTITLNGKAHEIAEQLTVTDLLASLEIPPSSVLVEVNTVALLKDEVATAVLNDGDRVELLRIVAGG